MREFNYEPEDAPEHNQEFEAFLTVNSGYMNQVEFEYLNLDQQLLYEAVRICESAFFWRFYSVSKKMKQIQEAYTSLLFLRDPQMPDFDEMAEDYVDEMMDFEEEDEDEDA